MVWLLLGPLLAFLVSVILIAACGKGRAFASPRFQPNDVMQSKDQETLEESSKRKKKDASSLRKRKTDDSSRRRRKGEESSGNKKEESSRARKCVDSSRRKKGEESSRTRRGEDSARRRKKDDSSRRRKRGDDSSRRRKRRRKKQPPSSQQPETSGINPTGLASQPLSELDRVVKIRQQELQQIEQQKREEYVKLEQARRKAQHEEDLIEVEKRARVAAHKQFEKDFANQEKPVCQRRHRSASTDKCSNESETLREELAAKTRELDEKLNEKNPVDVARLQYELENLKRKFRQQIEQEFLIKGQMTDLDKHELGQLMVEPKDGDDKNTESRTTPMTNCTASAAVPVSNVIPFQHPPIAATAGSPVLVSATSPGAVSTAKANTTSKRSKQKGKKSRASKEKPQISTAKEKTSGAQSSNNTISSDGKSPSSKIDTQSTTSPTVAVPTLSPEQQFQKVFTKPKDAEGAYNDNNTLEYFGVENKECNTEEGMMTKETFISGLDKKKMDDFVNKKKNNLWGNYQSATANAGHVPMTLPTVVKTTDSPVSPHSEPNAVVKKESKTKLKEPKQVSVRNSKSKGKKPKRKEPDVVVKPSPPKPVESPIEQVPMPVPVIRSRRHQETTDGNNSVLDQSTQHSATSKEVSLTIPLDETQFSVDVKTNPTQTHLSRTQLTKTQRTAAERSTKSSKSRKQFGDTRSIHKKPKTPIQERSKSVKMGKLSDSNLETANSTDYDKSIQTPPSLSRGSDEKSNMDFNGERITMADIDMKQQNTQLSSDKTTKTKTKQQEDAKTPMNCPSEAQKSVSKERRRVDEIMQKMQKEEEEKNKPKHLTEKEVEDQAAEDERIRKARLKSVKPQKVVRTAWEEDIVQGKVKLKKNDDPTLNDVNSDWGSEEDGENKKEPKLSTLPDEKEQKLANPSDKKETDQKS